MNFVDNLLEIIEIIGNTLANFVDFIINLPTLFTDLITVLPNPLYGVATVFISFIIIIILAKVVKTFVG